MLFRLLCLGFSVVVLVASLTGLAAPALVIPASLGVVLFLILVLRRPAGPPGRGAFGQRRQVIVDGSNVMYWKNGEPRLDSVADVVVKLKALGFTPGVMFDANVGYLLTGDFQNDAAMSKMLKLPKDRVMVAPRGTTADELILQAARDLGARIVTNDRFRDWSETYPEVTSPGFLIQGRYQQGDVKLLTDA